jgi:hypothetical protein
MPTFRSILPILSAVIAMLLVAAACETAPPVQEMSDARQAIAVAREAGAADLAATELAQAELYLESAEKKLGDHAYREARNDALAAKSRALQALKLSEAGKEPGSD